MAFTMFPGQYGQATGGTWIPPERLQTSQSGGSYIGGMAPQLPTQDMSFMWGGNTPAAPAGGTGPLGPLMGVAGGADPFANPINPNAQFDPYSASTGGMAPGGGYAPIPGMSATSAPAAPGWSQSMLPQAGTPTPGSPEYMAQVANGSISGPNQYAGNSLDLGYGNGMPGSYAAGGGASAYGGAPDPYADPYLSGRADDITRRTQDMLGEAFAGIQGNFVGTGGLGGSRQAVAQGQAGAKAADYLSGQLAGMYSGDWNAGQNRNLSRYQGDQSNALGNKQADYGFFTQNRSLDQGDFRNGLAAYGMGNEGDWDALLKANGVFSPWSGYGSSTNTSQSGGGWQGAVGGGLSGLSFAKMMGWLG